LSGLLTRGMPARIAGHSRMRARGDSRTNADPSSGVAVAARVSPGVRWSAPCLRSKMTNGRWQNVTWAQKAWLKRGCGGSRARPSRGRKRPSWKLQEPPRTLPSDNQILVWQLNSFTCPKCSSVVTTIVPAKRDGRLLQGHKVRRSGLRDVERTASDYCEFGWHDQWAELRIFRLVRRNKRDYYGSEGWEFESLRAH